jgi:putative effector of murein hydrolase
VADARDNEDREKGTQTDETPSLTQDVSFDCMPLPISPLAAHRTFMATYFPLLLSVIFGLVVGVPVLASTGDGRVLDGCVIWLFWLLTIRIQQIFRKCSLLGSLQRIKNAITTLLNPVLLTTSLLLAYTRIKNAASPGLDLTETLGRFSKGTPIYALWTSSVLGTALPDNPTRWFGAGDAALSILEVGILIWGFKLYECRRQLFSQAGVITILTSVAASAANVFLSVLIAHAVGLEEHEALAFAARSTTLALARPSIKAVHGNVAVNAALVVSNGVVGQLMYPLMPRALGLRGDPKPKPLPSSNDSRALIASPRLSSGPAAENQSTQSQHEGRRDDRRDNPVTIATGVAVGINGAAMGVAYLYLQKSRAAPYAAVAMTAFGMMTVVFTTIEPFRGTVLYLASS